MSVLQVVGTVIGAVIGTFIAPGAGTLMGAAIGGAIGSGVNAIVNPQRIEGARLGDLTVVSSAAGAVRPIGYGKIRVAGNVIWAIPIIEHKKTSKGGGKGGPVTTTYTYGATFALALCEGPVDAVTRIWADSKLVYDSTAQNPNGAINAFLGISDAILSPGFNFRFYPGDGTQTADSIIEAHEGVGNVPGYRGTCYLVFDDIPLDNYGNRIPNITAEVVFSAAPAFDWQVLDLGAGIYTDRNTYPTRVAADPVRGVGYVFGFQTFNSDYGIVAFNLATMTKINEKPIVDVFAPVTLATGDTGGSIPDPIGNFILGPDGGLYFTSEDYSARHLVRVDPDTLIATAWFSAPIGASANTTTSFAIQNMCFLVYLDPVVGVVGQIICQGFNNTLGALSTPLLAYIWDLHGTGAVGNALCPGRIALNAGEAWALSTDSNLGGVTTYIDKIDQLGVVTPMAQFAPSDFNASATTFSHALGNASSLIYDEGDDSILFPIVVTDGGGINFWTYQVKWSDAGGIIYSTLANTTGNDSSVSYNSRISTGTYARMYGDQMFFMDSATGDIISQDTWPIETFITAQLYDSDDQLILAVIQGVTVSQPLIWAKMRVGRKTSTGTTLGAIVFDQCERAGFTADDVDVSDLTDEVDGYVVSQRALVSDILSPLLQIYLVNAVESDYVLTFTHRGGSTVADLVQDDLVRVNDQTEPFTETRQQEIELPTRVTLTYIDSDKDFQQNTQMSRRARHPNPTVFTDNQTDLQLAVVTTATPAKQMAERILTSVWNERNSYACRLAPKFGYLDAGDPVTLTLDDGYVIRGRLTKADVGVDHSIDATIVVEADGQYISLAVADDGVPWAGSAKINKPLPSKLILLDTPLLRDVDDLGGTAIRGYWAGGSYQTNGGWPGAALQVSPDAATWTTIDTSGTEMTWGIIETPPADPASFWRTQFDGTMTVKIVGGTDVPTSTDDLGLANLANPMAIIKSNGQVEIIQYRDVTALGGDRYTLSAFYRGVRGTDAMGGGIRSGDTFVLLNTSAVSEIAIPIGDHNVVEFYRLPTAGSLAAMGLIYGAAYHGRDLMPYAPVDGAATLSGSPEDIVLTWVRRTRFGGELRDGIDTVPLNEASEAYEIDILDVPGGTALRTLTATSPTVTYAHADIVSDFGSVPSELSVDIYQMSEVVGRGFATEQLLEVA